MSSSALSFSRVVFARHYHSSTEFVLQKAFKPAGLALRVRKELIQVRGMMESAASGNGTGEEFSKPRVVVKRLLSRAQPEGEGATVWRSIGRPEVRNFDPFLLLDYFSSTGSAGFPDHPHRGFETVTYMLEGAFTHQDFLGHKGKLEAGDVQWMTAGRGIVHSEMPANTGLQRGLQLWVNLSSKDKMIPPNYQELQSKDVPKAEKDGVQVAVIAGESLGVKSPVFTRTPTLYLDFTMQPGSVLHQLIPQGWNAFVYTLEGSIVLGKPDDQSIGPNHTVLLGDGDGLSAWNTGSDPSHFVLVAGKPLNEEVAQYGPFVMNSNEELKQAMQDFRNGRNGFEKARTWRSVPVSLAFP
ncbi:hypothetical protein CY35_16G011400 [Sphagnum magellanicum]|nr:hypothetical protein CY35_16G011400 [Sphagnum magellanicum]